MLQIFMQHGSFWINVYDGERDEPRGHEEMILRRTTITVLAAQYSLLLHLLFILQFMFELNFCCCCFRRVPLGGNC